MPTLWNATQNPNLLTKVHRHVVGFRRFTTYSYLATTPSTRFPTCHPSWITSSRPAPSLDTIHVPDKRTLNDGDSSCGQGARAELRGVWRHHPEARTGMQTIRSPRVARLIFYGGRIQKRSPQSFLVGLRRNAPSRTVLPTGPSSTRISVQSTPCDEYKTFTRKAKTHCGLGWWCRMSSQVKQGLNGIACLPRRIMASICHGRPALGRF